jgi:predicted Zn-dependent peptidase
MGGKIAPNDADRIKTRFSDWVPSRLTRPAADFNRRVPVLGNNTAVSTFEIRSPAVAGSDPKFPAVILSTFAMGVGKDSSLFRVVREKLRISYRQEAILWPSPTGFELRLLIARSDPSFNPELGSSVKAELEADVDKWTDATRDRAIGMARGSYQFKTGPNPMYLSVRAPLSSSLEDQTFFRLFWQFKSGSAWNAETFVARLESVSTEDLKSAAKELLQKSIVTAIIGMKGRTAN